MQQSPGHIAVKLRLSGHQGVTVNPRSSVDCSATYVCQGSAVILGVVPYIYASVALVKIVYDRHLPARTFQTFKWIAIAAVIYGLWTVLGGDPPTVVNAMVALLLSAPLYPFFIRSMEAAAERKRASGRPDP